MIHYVLVKITINVLGQAKVIFAVVVCHYGVPELMATDQDLLFISKFWSSLYYFLGIKQKLSRAFHPQIDN